MERVQSFVGDAICDGGTIDWEKKKEFQGLTDEQLCTMSSDDLEESEHSRMRSNAFSVCKELSLRMDGAVAPGGYMKAFVSYEKHKMFFNDEKSLKEYINAPENRKLSLPGGYYYSYLETFISKHFEIGEKYAEFVKYSCSESNMELCRFCQSNPWNGPPFQRVPKPCPDYAAEKYKYLSVFETPKADRHVHDFQLRKNAQKLFAAGTLSTIHELDSFSTKLICPLKLVEEYVDDLSTLSTRKEKRKMKRKRTIIIIVIINIIIIIIIIIVVVIIIIIIFIII